MNEDFEKDGESHGCQSKRNKYFRVQKLKEVLNNYFTGKLLCVKTREGLLKLKLFLKWNAHDKYYVKSMNGRGWGCLVENKQRKLPLNIRLKAATSQNLAVTFWPGISYFLDSLTAISGLESSGVCVSTSPLGGEQ